MSPDSFHPIASSNMYIAVIIPIAVPKPYTYFVPTELIKDIKIGIRVEVQFGKNKLYSALVIKILDSPPPNQKPKSILSIIDEEPIIFEPQIKLWQWMSAYYSCTLGEVMNAALPASMKLSSETTIILSPIFDGNYDGFNDKEYMIAEALSIQNELSISDIRDILAQKTVYPLINRLLQRKIIYLKEELLTKYKPKEVSCVRLKEPYASSSAMLEIAFNKLNRSDRQVEAMMAFLQLSQQQEFVQCQEVYKKANVDSSVLKAMEKKEVLEIYKKEVSRIAGYEEELIDSHELSDEQIRILEEIKSEKEKLVTLIHGVTGSGKTRVYVELINEAIARGEQVLYLLPEIALTAQLVSRLQKIYGDQIAVYHSRMNNSERVEVWQSVLDGKQIVMGARSGLFLPYQNLKLIIVDEEHDTSYKQNDPAPRYNARDVSVYLSHLYQAKVVLGTATPSIESYFNAKTKKYQLVEMPERFGGLELPEAVLVDIRDELKKQTMQSHFTSVLLEELKAALERGEQAILFQNRRGYAPNMRCTSCDWHAECINCDVSLTYHKHFNNLRCHYCGYQTALPVECPACGSKALTVRGFGTEKIEDDLQIFLPDAKIGRLDFDTVRAKNAHARIINDFEEKRIDILVGTQMVTKGLDFDNVGIVGILSADHLFQFPDFRATERAFQMMIQVSGRAGRKFKRGKVIIQASNMSHPVLREILDNDFGAFYTRETSERLEFSYPPYFRLIKITVKHRNPQLLNEAAKVFAKHIKSRLGHQVMGPAVPTVPRVRNQFILDFLIKLEKNSKNSAAIKQFIFENIQLTKAMKGFSTVRFNVDVDPN
ncbi:MAG: primosomal protein N' (replication factor Y) [Saprospiraceae bacterium]